MRDDLHSVATGYECIGVKRKVIFPDIIASVGGKITMTKNSEFDLNQNSEAVKIPKAAKNSVCPCGSGKLYKRCHGKKVTITHVLSVE